MGYDLVDVFMDVDFYCTKSNGKQVGLSWATGYANHYKSDDTSYTYGFNKILFMCFFLCSFNNLIFNV